MDTPTEPDASALDRAALERTAPARAALRVRDAPHYTLDGMRAAATALRIVRRVKPFRAALAPLPDLDHAAIDAFEDYARALRCVQTEVLRRVERKKKASPVHAPEGWRLRGQLMAYAQALSYKGRIEPELLDQLREGSGHRDLAEDLLVLVQEFLALPPAVFGPEAPVTREDLERAAVVADEIHVTTDGPVEIDLSQSALLGERRKLGGLLLRAHSETLRGITYLRWHHGDAAELVPSLYVTRGRKSSPEADEPAPELPPEPAPVDDDPLPGPLAEPVADPLADRVAPAAPPTDSPFVDDEEAE